MFVVIVDWTVKPGAVEAFAAAVAEQARTSRTAEPACQRFDVAQDETAPEVFLLYEIYDDAAAFAAHCDTAHFHSFSAAVADMTVSKTVRRFSLSVSA